MLVIYKKSQLNVLILAFSYCRDCRVVRDPQTLKSKGYGFVSFVKKAVSSLHITPYFYIDSKNNYNQGQAQFYNQGRRELTESVVYLYLKRYLTLNQLNFNFHIIANALLYKDVVVRVLEFPDEEILK